MSIIFYGRYLISFIFCVIGDENLESGQTFRASSCLNILAACLSLKHNAEPISFFYLSVSKVIKLNQYRQIWRQVESFFFLFFVCQCSSFCRVTWAFAQSCELLRFSIKKKTKKNKTGPKCFPR